MASPDAAEIDDPRRVPDLEFDGLSETEIFDRAPVFLADRVFWEGPEGFDPSVLIADLDGEAWTRRWSDGLCRVWVPQGRGPEARERIRAWCEERDLAFFNARIESGVPFRDLSSIDPGLLAGLMATAVEWLFPRMGGVRRRLVAELGVEDEDVRSMMYLFVSDVTDRYDSGRQGRLGRVNYLAFLIGKMRTWPHDLARAEFGRVAVADRLARSRAVEAVAQEEHREPTEAQVAERMGLTVTEFRQRQEALSSLSGVRRPLSLADADDGFHGLPSDERTEGSTLDYAASAVLTRAILAAAVDGPKGPDPLGLASLYLTFWEGMSKAEVARNLDVLPKTVSAAIERVSGQIDREDLA